MTDNKKNLLKSGAKFRRPRQGRGLPRIMWVAVAVCIIGAIMIFRDQGGRVPTGIGEYQTVVTAPETGTSLQGENEPRSGDVDISDQTTTLTPEKPVGEPSTQAGDKTASQPPVKQVTTSDTTTKPAAAKPTKPAPQFIKPLDRGPYLVQTGSFGDAANAEPPAGSRGSEKARTNEGRLRWIKS